MVSVIPQELISAFSAEYVFARKAQYLSSFQYNKGLRTHDEHAAFGMGAADGKEGWIDINNVKMLAK